MRVFMILAANIFALTLGQPAVLGKDNFAVDFTTESYSEDDYNYKYTPDYYAAGNYSAANCTESYECFGYNTVCLNGTCACLEGYTKEPQYSYYYGSNYLYCSPPPNYLFAPCETICQEPYACRKNSDNYGYNIYGQTNGKSCQCGDKFHYADGLCVLNCTENEEYNPNKLQCVARCTVNELRVNDDCKPIAALGGNCELDQQCTIQYSECKMNKCACRDGFAANKDGVCNPRTVTCPSGFALRRGSGYRICQFKRQPMPIDGQTDPDNPMVNIFANSNDNNMIMSKMAWREETELKDDCPVNYYCMVGSDMGQTPTVNTTGYCCPKLKSDCPIGKAHASATCQPQTYAEYCPYETHYCYSSCGSAKQSCCPRPCPLNTILINGSCYSQARIGDSCRIKEQCTDSKADCINGKCKCGRRTEEIGSGMYKYCIQRCEENEIQMNDECYPYLKLGDSCRSEEYRCPGNSYCGENNTCQCFYGNVKLSPEVCVPEPTCPSYDWYSKPAVWDESSTYVYPEPNEKTTMDKINNSTFCKLNNQSSSLPGIKNIVDKCPTGQFCSYYTQNVGVCCKKPEPNCYGSAKIIAVKECEVYDPYSCGANSTCYQYFYPADSEDKSNRVCCDNSEIHGW